MRQRQPVNDERDAYHQTLALANAVGWLNHQEIDEYTARIRERRQP
jgi:hypothetical protein